MDGSKNVELAAGSSGRQQLEDSLRISKALADGSRLRILSELLSGERCAEELATITGLAPSTASFHLKKLVDAGLVSSRKEQYYAIYSLRPQTLELRLIDLLDFADSEQAGRDGRREHERRQVYQAFFEKGRLARMPAQRRKRLLVLEVFASMFEAGTTYPEQRVNELIAPLYADYCLVRRLLVDEGFMSRDRGGYCRTARESRPGPVWAAGRGEGQLGRQAQERKSSVDSRKKQLKRDYLLDGKRAGIFGSSTGTAAACCWAPA
jgi:DNA-binding transcriptional ArsR family regulator